MSWQVYMIKTCCGKYYTGITTDVDRRYHEHLEMYSSKTGKGAKFFRGHQPEAIVFLQTCDNRSVASKREAEIKKMSANKKHALSKAFSLKSV